MGLGVASGRGARPRPRNRSACSSGSLSSLYPLASSRPAITSSNRSVTVGSSRDWRASGETSVG